MNMDRHEIYIPPIPETPIGRKQKDILCHWVDFRMVSVNTEGL